MDRARSLDDIYDALGEPGRRKVPIPEREGGALAGSISYAVYGALPLRGAIRPAQINAN
jgi:hypothetical protein